MKFIRFYNKAGFPFYVNPLEIVCVQMERRLTGERLIRIEVTHGPTLYYDGDFKDDESCLEELDVQICNLEKALNYSHKK